MATGFFYGQLDVIFKIIYCKEPEREYSKNAHSSQSNNGQDIEKSIELEIKKIFSTNCNKNPDNQDSEIDTCKFIIRIWNSIW